MRMLCYKCRHSWNYKGKNSEGKGYITCPGCMYKIRVDKALIEPLSVQKLLTNLPKKRPLPNELPKKLPKKLLTTNRIIVKRTPEIIQDPPIKIRILSPPLPLQIQKRFDEKEQDQDDPFSNLPTEEPNFEVRAIGFDPLKTLNHQMGFI